MALRCLLFSSNAEVRPPIWQVLADLGIEGEYCERAVDAVERVTTQLFQIVITDWEDQPEASFLLKTARDLKATHRPLTLAIVGNDAKVPEALRAGANSILIKPIRVEQVRDTMSTACQLLRSKQSFAAPAAVAALPETPVSAVAPNSTTSSAAAAPARARTPEASEKAFRAGEFLTSSAPSPSAQFDTESEVRLDQASPAEVDALTELEPMASAVESQQAEPAEPQAPLTGWAALQERLTRTGLKKAAEASPEAGSPKAETAKNELLTYIDMSAPAKPVSVSQEKNPEPEKPRETKAEAALFAYMDGERPQAASPPRKSPKIGRILFAGVTAAACLTLFVIPQTRQRLQMGYGNIARLARNWLNPQPVPVQQVAPQHETFTADEDYKLPAAANIPDATTDPSQIRVIPVIDPTVKPRNADSNATQTAPASVPTNESQSAPNGVPQSAPLDGTPALPPPNVSNADASATVANAGGNLNVSVSAPPAAPKGPTPNEQLTVSHPVVPLASLPVSISPPPMSISTNVPAPTPATIPSSLRSQLASSAPDASGAKPVDSAMAAIEPVNLPESVARSLLAQKVDPAYPDAARASKQGGSVTLQVLIGRDGTVQDAKFLQGSLMFARAAIDAVTQWRFRPYLFNGRAASVQSAITLNFKPSS
ncbi:MAG TPA: TonB family protein [Candidatus Sulfotelmatobacter sp.]|jgi:protein TonB